MQVVCKKKKKKISSKKNQKYTCVKHVSPKFMSMKYLFSMKNIKYDVKVEEKKLFIPCYIHDLGIQKKKICNTSKNFSYIVKKYVFTLN